MISKKAQSEIITTVLIILLVLAAIVIVWQVVSGTMNNTSGEIARQKKCTGTLLNVVKATAAIGTCNYINKGALVCDADSVTAGNQLTLANQPKGACPVFANCDSAPIPWTAETTKGKVTISRDGGNSDVKDVEAMIFVGGLQNTTSTDTFLALDQKPVEISGLNVGDIIKVAPFIKSDNYLCSGVSEEKIVVSA